MARVALVSATASRGRDSDEVPLLDALIWRGVDAAVVTWDDRGVDWGEFDLAVIRSTWDYSRRNREFIRWLHRVERRTRLANRAELVEWNIDKRYLSDLASAALPVVPTTFVEPGDAVRIPDRGEIVVKPVVSAGAADTRRYRMPDHGDEAQAHVDALLAEGRPVMVQPYLPSVEDPGEIDLVFLGGRYSHAVRKVAQLLEHDAPTSELPDDEFAVATEATREQVALAERAVRIAVDRFSDGEVPLYARVDLVLGVRDEPMILELELAEPSLYLATSEGAADRFADAIANALG
jgi:glutathione synthase/RimK-type ligase-like ATP-grasp enzyme